MIDTDDLELNAVKHAEFWAVVARGNLGFRFGPYTATEIGQIMERSTRENLPVVVSATMGRDFDWTLAREMRGWPADYFPMSDGPKDGTKVIGDLNGLEAVVCWSVALQSWRTVEPDGTIGAACLPIRWRRVEAGDA